MMNNEGFTLHTHKDALHPALQEKQAQVDYWGDRCCKAEARVAELEGALHKIADEQRFEPSSTLGRIEMEIRRVARAALAHGSGEASKMEQIMEKTHYEEGARHPALGPHYFAARDIVRAFADKFEAEQFEPLLKSFSQRLYEKALEDWQTWLFADMEINIQGAIRQMVDETVQALLMGQAWALERYPLAKYHNGASIRAAVAKHIPADLQDRRIADLEAEVARLRGALQPFIGQARTEAAR